MVKKSLSFCLVSLGAGLCAGLLPAVASAHEETSPESFSARVDAHAPIGVMGDHLHKQGEFMLSYRYKYMDMDGMRAGTDSLASADVYNRGYMIAPLDMSMQMHMVGLMYAPSDRLTLMAMAPYMEKDMDHQQNPVMGGRKFTTRTDGIGDVRLSGLVGLMDGEFHRLHLNMGVSLPTGSIDERDDTLVADQHLPYAMQLGSGTWDLVPGLTYMGHDGSWSWGAQLSAVLRLDRNDNGYALGDVYKATTWIARPLTRAVSLSLRLAYENWQGIDGRDRKLDMMMPQMTPTADARNSGGEQLGLVAGMNFLMPGGVLKGHRLALELNLPVYRNLDGLQMETDLAVTLGWQKAF